MCSFCAVFRRSSYSAAPALRAIRIVTFARAVVPIPFAAVNESRFLAEETHGFRSMEHPAVFSASRTFPGRQFPALSEIANHSKTANSISATGVPEPIRLRVLSAFPALTFGLIVGFPFLRGALPSAGVLVFREGLHVAIEHVARLRFRDYRFFGVIIFAATERTLLQVLQLVDVLAQWRVLAMAALAFFGSARMMFTSAAN